MKKDIKLTAKQLKADRAEVALFSEYIRAFVVSGDWQQALKFAKAIQKPLERLAAPPLDDAFIKSVSGAIHYCWQSIGGDAISACAEAGEKEPDNEGAMELCLDADRLTMYPGGKEGNAAQDLLRLAYDGHGYTTVFKFLCKSINLN